MKKLNYILRTATLSAIVALAIGCSNKNSDPTPGPETGYMVGIYHGTSEAEATYLTTVGSLDEGSISLVGKGEQMPYYAHFYKAGNTHIANMLWNDGLIHAYTVNDGNPSLFSSGLLSANARVRVNTGDNTALFIATEGDTYATRRHILYHIDDKGKTIITKPVQTYQNPDTSYETSPQGGIVRGNKLYISQATIDRTERADWFYADPKKTAVSVYSYPQLELLSSDVDERLGSNLYSGTYSSILTKDEAGDIYSISASSKGTGFVQPSTSGILRIKNGSDKFDDDYFFNVEALGYKIYNGVYAGNGKLVGTIISTADDAANELHNLFGPKTHHVAILDLNAKTIKIVAEIPAHVLLETTPYLVQGSSVYVPVYTDFNTSGYIYNVNASAGTAKRGAQITGGGVCLYLATY